MSRDDRRRRQRAVSLPSLQLLSEIADDELSGLARALAADAFVLRRQTSCRVLQSGDLLAWFVWTRRAVVRGAEVKTVVRRCMLVSELP